MVETQFNVSETCIFHTLKTIQHIFLGSTWALKMVDSAAKFPSSILMGNIINFGNYDECLSVTVQEEWGSFVGQHCLASLPNPFKLGSESEAINKPNAAVGWSLCIPSSCSAWELENALRTIIPLNISVLPNLCQHRNQHSSFNICDWIAIIILVALAIMCIIGTTYTLLLKKSVMKYRWLTMFCWYNNGKRLFSTKPSPDSIPVLHGIRVFSIIWVVLGHSYEFHQYLPHINYLKGVELVRSWRYLSVTDAVLAVDSCFLLSGLLLCYIFMKVMDQGQRFNLPVFYLHRFFRIIPVLAMMILLEVSLIQKIGSGPLWEVGVASYLKEYCNQHWWSTLLFLQNYVNVKKMCIPVSWFLAVDMQMYWLSPIFLLALHKKPKVGIGLLITAILFGIVIAFQQAYYFHDLASSVPTNGDANDRYYQTHTRYVPWVIGMASGYVLYQTEEWRSKITGQKAMLSKCMVICGWTFATTILIGVICWVYPYEQYNYVYNGVEQSLYLALARPLWAIGISWIIFACCSGYGGPVNAILGWKGLLPLSRLTFCIYLIHVDVISTIMGMTRTSGYLSEIGLIQSFIGYLVLTVLLSIVMTLTIEAPMIRLEKIIIRKK